MHIICHQINGNFHLANNNENKHSGIHYVLTHFNLSLLYVGSFKLFVGGDSGTIYTTITSKATMQCNITIRINISCNLHLK